MGFPDGASTPGSTPASAEGAERRSAESRLAQAGRLLRINELLVAGLIHDLRTPLMAINLSAEVALMRSHAEAVEQAARRIKAGGERMSRLFDHLLNLSRIPADGPGLDLRRNDLAGVVEAAVRQQDSGGDAWSFTVSTSGDNQGVFDAEQVQFTVQHILSTLTAHAPPGAVTVEVDGQHSDRLWLRIGTAGVVPTDVQERLFVSREPRGGLELPGVALGLAEVDPLVRTHGGSVLGRSRPGIGTVFELLLPRDASAAG